MRRTAVVFLLALATAAQTPEAAANGFLRTHAAARGLDAAALQGVRVLRQYRTGHNGVTHFVYRQQFRGLDVINGLFTVNVDRDGRILNAGGSLFPAPAAELREPSVFSVTRAAAAAVRAVNPDLARSYRPDVLGAGRGAGAIRLRASGLGAEVEGRPSWYGHNGALLPAWEFWILDEDGVHAYSVVVDSLTEKVLEKESLTHFQSAQPRGLVFNTHSPQPNPRPGFATPAPRPYVERVLLPLTGDPKASPAGWISGNETAGNNAIVGANPLGIRFAVPETARADGADFRPPLQLGPGTPSPNQFPDAASVNLFYWVNLAHDLFYAAGFDEAAGSYQQSNFGRGGVEGDAIKVYSQFGAAAPSRANLNNAFYTTRRTEDGAEAMIAMYLGTGFGVLSDGAYDAEVIVHEYTHGVSLRLVPRLTGFQGGAMGEAWSDFFSLEFTLPEGAPPDGIYPVGEYLFQSFGPGLRTRPYSTDLEVNPITFADLGRVTNAPAIHQDGGIWVQALWEMRANLIRQFGEREGRRRTRLLVVDGMKLCPPSPTMVDARDAILLADRAGFHGESQSQIWAAFARRGLGVLAHAGSVDSVHVAPSFETPSAAGSLRFFESSYVAGETVRIVLSDANLRDDAVRVELTSSSGDLEAILLQRQGSAFYGSIATSTASVTRNNGVLTTTAGDYISAYYTDEDTGSGPKQIDITVPVRMPYAIVSSMASALQFENETPLGLRAGFGVFRRYDLPFEFPFYGRRYRSLLIYTNGMLAFEIPVSTPCTDRTALPRFNGIAPLWMELRTNGSAQPNEDVYVSRPGPGAITFRWAAETDAVFSAPEAVNFAATLYDDGRIEFRYGGGNRNLTVETPFAGCPVSTPTVGISPGTETYSQVSILSGRAVLENASTTSFLPSEGFSSLPSFAAVSPQSGQTVQDVLIGRAVISDATSVVNRVDLYVDDVYKAGAVRQGPRPAECAAVQANDCAEFLFSLNLAGLGLAEGPHRLKMRAVNRRGGFTDSELITFTREGGQSGRPHVMIELPEPGSEITGTLRVRGYYISELLRISQIDILLDGLTLAPAPLLTRNDICAPFNPRPAACGGFDVNYNTRSGAIPISNGPHGLQVRVTDETGRIHVFPESPLGLAINNEANAPPTGVVVTPRQNDIVSGVITVSGHAWDPDGRITAVQLVVNGEVRAAIPYGQPRPAECTALENVPACPNIGFTLQYDTGLLRNGANVLGVRVTDNSGTSRMLPENRVNTNGMTVFVRN